MLKGKFIVFEGIDGSGKSTQISKLKNKLQQEGISVYTTFEPTDSPFGSMIHQVMIGRIIADHRVLAGLFVADRLDHLTNEVNGIKKMIDSGITVISDRYYFSSYAYHSVFMDMDWVIQANSVCKDILKPDLNIFLDVSPSISEKRILNNGKHVELYENEQILINVREKYFEAFRKLKEEERVCIISGEQDLDVITNQIWEEVKTLFK